MASEKKPAGFLTRLVAVVIDVVVVGVVASMLGGGRANLLSSLAGAFILNSPLG